MSTDRPRNVISIGNFDGVHLGHRALIERAREIAGPDGHVIAVAFDPHPLTALRPELAPPSRLTTFEQRAEQLKLIGADEVVQLEPSPDLLRLEPQAFLERMMSQYDMAAMVEGPDFRFGKDRAGDVRLLTMEGDRLGFRVDIIEPVEVGLTDHLLVTVSSTMVRWLLHRGRVTDAARLLGRCYAIEGEVVAGDGRGRTIGIPTANVETSQTLPGRGVYAGLAWRLSDGSRTSGREAGFPCAVNIGLAPTFRKVEETRAEVHLIGFNGKTDDYGWSLRVEFQAFVRDELRFPDAETAISQIRRDVRRADRMARRNGAGEPVTM